MKTIRYLLITMLAAGTLGAAEKEPADTNQPAQTFTSEQLEKQDPGRNLRKMLNQIVVPELNVREANPRDVMESLREQSKKFSRDGSAINFIWMIPPAQKLPYVTLNLKKTSMLDVVSLVTELTKLRYRIDEHAVVIYAPEPEAKAPPPDVKAQ